MSDQMRNEIRSAILRFLVVVIACLGLFLIMALFASCDSEPPRFKNHYLRWEGEDMSNLQMKVGNGPWQNYANGEFFYLEFITYENDLGEPMYRLSYAGEIQFHFVYFDGFNNYVKDKNGELVKDTNIELPLDHKTANSFSSTGRLIYKSEYTISLSYDKSQ